MKRACQEIRLTVHTTSDRIAGTETFGGRCGPAPLLGPARILATVAAALSPFPNSLAKVVLPLALILLALAGGIWASQRPGISPEKPLAGTVRDDEDELPLAGASVVIRRTSSAADLTTDAYGRFVIAKPTRGATLDISAPGHQDSTLTIGKDNVSDIYLSPTVLEGAVLHAYPRAPVSATVKAGQVAGQADAQG